VQDRPVICWFRNDLRLTDNPALHEAVVSKQPLICLYVFDDKSKGLRAPGGASNWWLHDALKTLGEAIAEKGGALFLMRGNAVKVIADVVAETGADFVVWNRRYDQAGLKIDEAIETDLQKRDVRVASFNASLLYEPWQVRNKAGAAYRVYSAYQRAASALGVPEKPIGQPRQLTTFKWQDTLKSLDLAELRLQPKRPDWAKGFKQVWSNGEKPAHKALSHFIKTGLEGYAKDRDRPDEDATTRLSPFLHFGQISPHQVWHGVKDAFADKKTGASKADVDKFISELTWRDYAAHLLYHFPELPHESHQTRLDQIGWRKDEKALHAWQKGQTGYPIVDAGMRELWQTGWLPNRVRMIVASFLVKDLLIDWRRGEEWFWDTLVDADAANNAVNWQWVAGSGVDAAPFFRIFNPVLQGEKFDPKGAYVKRFVPELGKLPPALIHKPWKATEAQLAEAGVTLGKDYPAPIIDHDFARQRALDQFRKASR